MAENNQPLSMAEELEQQFAELQKQTPPTEEPGNEEEPTEPENPATEEPADKETQPSEPTEPAKPAEGGEQATEPTEPTQPEQPEKAPELILGKFKNPEELAKAYTNLEKMYSQKQQKAAEERKYTEPDEFDRMVASEIENVALQTLEKTIGTISNPEHLKEATAALAMYKRTGDLKHIETARGFLDNATDRRLEVELRNVAGQIKQAANAHRDEIELAPQQAVLQEIEDEDPDWLAEPLHQNLIVMALQLNRKADIREVKKQIDAIGENAVKKYIAAEAKKAAVAAAKKPTVSIKDASRAMPPEPPKDFKKMSIEEQLADQYSKLK